MPSRSAIVLMSLAGGAAMFGLGFVAGLGILDSPPTEHATPAAAVSSSAKAHAPETTASTAHDDDQPLTPVYPAQPAGVPAPEPAQTAQQPTPQPPAAETATAESSPEAAAPAQNATPAALSQRNACDIDACTRAYRSFRASDCTYQPYSGPRQLCTEPGAALHASSHGDARTAHVRVHRGDRVETDDVPRDSGRSADDRADDSPVVWRYRRDYTADGEDDRIVPADIGRADDNQ